MMLTESVRGIWVRGGGGGELGEGGGGLWARNREEGTESYIRPHQTRSDNSKERNALTLTTHDTEVASTVRTDTHPLRQPNRRSPKSPSSSRSASVSAVTASRHSACRCGLAFAVLQQPLHVCRTKNVRRTDKNAKTNDQTTGLCCC